MAIVLTDDKHYKEIAHYLRQHYYDTYNKDPRVDVILDELLSLKFRPADIIQGIWYATELTADIERRLGYELGVEHGFDDGHSQGIEEGKQAEYDKFWDTFQDGGNRNSYRNAFRGEGWTVDNFKPKYDIIPNYKGTDEDAGQGIFIATRYVGSLKKAFEEAGVKFDTQYVQKPNNMFDGATGITELPHIDLSSATSMSSVFYGCGAKTISVTLPDRELDYTNCFRSSYLENLEITGTLNGTNLNFQWSKKLSKEGITNIINALSTTTNGLTVTFSKTAVDKAFETSSGANDGSTSAEWDALGGTNRPRQNWTISLV